MFGQNLKVDSGIDWTEVVKKSGFCDMNFTNTKKKNPTVKDEIKRMTFNNPATVVLWADSSKTVVKSTDNDEYNPRIGFLYAYFEKHSGLSKTQCGKFLDAVELEAEEQRVKIEKKANKKK